MEEIVQIVVAHEFDEAAAVVGVGGEAEKVDEGGAVEGGEDVDLVGGGLLRVGEVDGG